MHYYYVTYEYLHKKTGVIERGCINALQLEKPINSREQVTKVRYYITEAVAPGQNVLLTN